MKFNDLIEDLKIFEYVQDSEIHSECPRCKHQYQINCSRQEIMKNPEDQVVKNHYILKN